MLKKLNVLLNIVIESSVGVFIGSSIYTYWDYRIDCYFAEIAHTQEDKVTDWH